MRDLEWLKEEVYEMMPSYSELYNHPDYTTVETVKMLDRFIGLIDQVEQPEKTVIPDYVAEYLEYAKSDTTLMRVMELANTRREWDKWNREYDWIEEYHERFARAWLDGYTVEEKKYTVLIGQATESTGLFLSKAIYQKEVTLGTNLDYFYSEESDTHLTEEEIKGFKDGIYWSFAKEVTE